MVGKDRERCPRREGGTIRGHETEMLEVCSGDSG